jgi:hypothetical protein
MTKARKTRGNRSSKKFRAFRASVVKRQFQGMEKSSWTAPQLTDGIRVYIFLRTFPNFLRLSGSRETYSNVDGVVSGKDFA